jgi:hypothetical protein
MVDSEFTGVFESFRTAVIYFTIHSIWGFQGRIWQLIYIDDAAVISLGLDLV